MEKVAGGRIEMHNQTVCYNELCTGVKRGKSSGASVWERTPGKL